MINFSAYAIISLSARAVFNQNNQKIMKLKIDEWKDKGAIPAQFAFGKPGTDEPFAPSNNISPAMNWSNPPEGTKSFTLIMHDPDVPSISDDVNQKDREVPASLARCDFYHWVLIDIPSELSEIAQGAGSEELIARGKPVGLTKVGITGKNSYTDWFSGDSDMEGIYGGYDGPCPPWNDSIAHNYIFTLYALDIPTLGLSGAFTGPEVLTALKGHVLAETSYSGKYSMNPKVKAS